MGGCVISLMSECNALTLKPNASATEYVTLREKLKGKFVQTMPETETKSSSAVYRLNGISATEFDTFCAGSSSRLHFYGTLMNHCRQRGSAVAARYRPVECVKQEPVASSSGKEQLMDITYLGPSVDVSYTELAERILRFGCGLRQLGMKPNQNVSIYLNTCLQWVIGIYGIWSIGCVATTVYANLGQSALAHSLHETDSAAIICDANNVENLIQFMVSDVVPVAPIIYLGKLPTGLDARGMTILSFEAIEASGAEWLAEGGAAGTGPSSSTSTALIMYTSGTTGDPKGVIHTHDSLIAGYAMLEPRISQWAGPAQPGDAYCVYLPLAHILEFLSFNVFLNRGSLVGFGTPRTLTDTTARPHGDLREYNPVFLVGVPRIFDTLKKAVEAKLPPPGTLKRRVFDHAYASRLAALRAGKDTPFWNEKVFKAARAVMGTGMRAMLTGGGPTSASTLEFTNVVFGPCVVGYGMTETVCVGGHQLIGDTEPNSTGLLVMGQEVKLVDVDVYKHTDQPEPRGELCMRGPFLFKGYYKQPELTKEVLDEDGWFHTGDVASMSPDGKLRIVGRVKALAKNCLGEYIALETLEAVYGANDLLRPNGVCVLVHPDKHYISALALTDEAKAVPFAKAHGIRGDYPDVLKDQAFQRAAAASMAQTARAANRAPFECVRNVRVLNDEWTPENNILTAAMKLKRRIIDEHYDRIIKELFIDP